MSQTLERIKALVKTGEVRVSEHGYSELAEDNLSAREVLAGVSEAVLVEDYPDFPKGPSVLVLQSGSSGQPIHVVWGIPKGHESPAVLVTAYTPDSAKWHAGFKRRRK